MMSDSDTLSGGWGSPELSGPEFSTAASAATPLPAELASAGLPPPVSPGREDVLGLRIAAALIDLVLLGGLFVIMGLTVGESSAAGGSFNVSLNGVWLLAFLAVALVYYFALEAWGGQTVGKRVFGLRISRAGERAPVGAVAVRTLLRVVDWLPLMYLLGFITMMATGTRRQRLGDLAARTSVTQVPVRHRGMALLPLAVVLLAATGLSVYRVSSAGGTQTYRAHGISFDYPAGWHVESIRSAEAGGAKKLWTTAVGPGTKLDLIIVSAYRVKYPVTAQNIDAITPELESAARQLFGGAVQAGPEKITMAGHPAVRFRGTGTMDGSRFESTIVFAFSGTTEYFANCQHTAARAAEVDQACHQVIGSFQAHGGTNNVSAAPTAPATSTAPAANGLEKMSAARVTHAAASAFTAAKSVRVRGTMVLGGRSERFDLRFEGKSARGSYTVKGAVIHTIVVGNDEYLKAGTDGWEAMGNPPDAAAAMADQWFKVSSAPSPGTPVFSRAAFATELATQEYQSAASVTQARLSGQKVVVITYQDRSKLYVANTGPAYPVRFDLTGSTGGRYAFSQYGNEFHIVAPENATDISQGG